MNLKGNFKILDSNVKIEANILESLYAGAKLLLTKAKPRIESEIKSLVRKALQDSPEIYSLQSGKLKFDFGLSSDPTQQIIESIVGSTYVYFKNFKLSRSGYSNVLSVYIQPDDFSNLLNSSFATVMTEKGVELPWLNWLLTQGDSILVSQHHVSYGASLDSRSGGAIMKLGGVFKVDSQFSGTQDNNFITRALEKYQDQIVDTIGKIL